MKKEVIYKIFSYHFDNLILNKKDLSKEIKALETDYEKANVLKLYNVLDKFKEKEEYIDVDDYVIKALKENFGLSKKDVIAKVSIDGKLYRVFFEYFNEMKETSHSFDVLQRNQKDLLARLEFLGIDYDILIKRQTRTLQDIGDEYGYTRERIRQKLNDIKKILKGYNNTLYLNYISYEDIKYLPKIKQAIVYANEGSNVESLAMYVFDESLKKIMHETTEEFKNMIITEDPDIDDFTEKNYSVISRYISNDPGFYMIKDELFNLYTADGIMEYKYLANYLYDNNKVKITLNKGSMEAFKKSLHGKLLEQRQDKKITQKLLKELVNNQNFVKVGPEKYLLKEYEPNSVELFNKLTNNLPIKGSSELENKFSVEISDSGLTVDEFYFYIKNVSSDENIKFSKYNIDISQNPKKTPKKI